ncbi:MAG: tyrosine-protein phosphatase [Candidatus Melainabacteria bacterium]|nr:tyrosine-protein phosphatase [Candidatus Melainabacteria bacterium]
MSAALLLTVFAAQAQAQEHSSQTSGTIPDTNLEGTAYKRDLQNTCLLTLHMPLAAEAETKRLGKLTPQVRSDLVSTIDNFDLVSDKLWRGAAPGKKGMQLLAKSGVKTVLDLRMPGLGPILEENQARDLGINYVHMPLTFNKPSMDKVAQFINIVESPINQPVFIHCRQGADRTGTLVGIMRLTKDNWTFDRTYAEMRQHHFKPWFQNLKSMVASFDNKNTRAQLAQAIKKDRQDTQAQLTAGNKQVVR